MLGSNSHFWLFYCWQIKRYEKLETVEERRKLAREIYDNFIMKELLSHTHVTLGFVGFLFFFSFTLTRVPPLLPSYLAVPSSESRRSCISVRRPSPNESRL